ncbi:hypothetical protein CC86DRAFT_459986 [Ophiobolus disseminans]|uniref:Uncharacterized protein n=1 Tax=Ophiobolus disseminans TaxID=1469910 RepID=A0A6A6ZGF7_9PLEO|nr:hypothetical protein CC86DRAFT_459986 [Ophiobolus disseminans]
MVPVSDEARALRAPPDDVGAGGGGKNGVKEMHPLTAAVVACWAVRWGCWWLGRRVEAREKERPTIIGRRQNLGVERQRQCMQHYAPALSLYMSLIFETVIELSSSTRRTASRYAKSMPEQGFLEVMASGSDRELSRMLSSMQLSYNAGHSSKAVNVVILQRSPDVFGQSFGLYG